MDHKVFATFLLFLGVLSGVLCQVSGEKSKEVNKTVEGRAFGLDDLKDLKGCIQIKSMSCFLDVSEDMVNREKRSVLAEADKAVALRGRADDDEETETPSQLTDSIGQLMDELTDIVKDSIVGFFRDGKDEDDEEEEETTTAVTEKDSSEEAEDDDEEDDSSRKLESRKKKKHKIHKLIALIKLLVLGAVLAAKLIILLKIFAAHLQIKFLIIAFAGLLINAARFFLDLKKGHHPQKVIYYEHAQHQHHYEGAEDEWSSGGPSESYWGRSYEEEEGQSAHDIAYSQQKPYSGHKKKEESGFSWWG